MARASGEILRLLFVDFLGSFAWFPFWWYTIGFRRFAFWCRLQLQYRMRQYSFRVWMRNFFVPMYGQYDWTGRLVSFFMRGVVLIGRGIAFFIEAVVYLFALLIWLFLPPIAFFLAIRSILIPFISL